MHRDYLLVLKHMHTRYLSFRHTVVSLNSKYVGTTFSKKVVEIDMAALEQAPAVTVPRQLSSIVSSTGLFATNLVFLICF